MENTEKPVDAKVITELTITEKVELQITDLKTPLKKFYEKANESIDEIEKKELSPALKKEASDKRTELRTKRVEGSKFVKAKIDVFKGYVSDWKEVDSFFKDESKKSEDRLISIETKCKEYADSLIQAVEDERKAELKALGETIFPEGLGKMSKTEFKITLKSTERKIAERKIAEEAEVEKLRLEAEEKKRLEEESKKLAKEKEKLEAENQKLKDQAEADAKELAEFRKAKAEKLAKEEAEAVVVPEKKKEPVKNKPAVAKKEVNVINDWVDSFTAPEIPNVELSSGEMDKIEFILNAFESFKRSAISI